MSKKMRTGLKKSVSMIVAVTTIVWLSGLAILLTPAITIVADERPSVVVGGVTVYDGDLISSNATNPDGTPTYASLDIYIAKVVSATETYKRLVLNPQVFDSYGHLKWGDVSEVSQTVMDAFSTSCLTREDGDTKVYAMAPDDDTGTKSWVNLTETEFVGATTGTYSANTAGAIYTINSTDAGNYTATGDLTTVTAFETYLTAGTLPAVSGAGTGLTVVLASDTPAAATLPTGTSEGATGVVVTKFNVSASSDGDVTIQSLKIYRNGIGSASSISKVYLYEGDARLTTGKTINTTTNLSTFTSLNYMVPAGTTKTLSILVDLADAKTDNHAFGVQAASDITTDGAAVSGSFPFVGNTMSLANLGASAYGTIITDASGSATYTRKIGEKEAIAAKFTVALSNENSELRRLSIYNSSNDVLNNMTLWRGSDKLADATENGRYFDFVLATPNSITKGETITYTLKADITSDNVSNSANLYIKNDADILIVGNTYGYGVDVDNTRYDGSDATEYTTVALEAGDITITSSGPVATTIAVDQNDVVLMDLSITALNDTVIEAYGFDLTEGGSIITDTDVVDIEFTCDGVGSISSTSVVTSSHTWTDFIDLAAGVTLNCSLIIDLESGADAGDTILAAIDIDDWQFRDDTTDTLFNSTSTTYNVIPSADQSGSTMTVAAAGLTVAAATSPAARTWVLGGSDVEIAGYTFAADDADDIIVEDITFTACYDESANAGSMVCGSGTGNYASSVMLSASLYDGTSPVGTAKSIDSSGNIAFTDLGWTVPAGTTRTLTVKANLNNSLPATTVYVTLGIEDGAITSYYDGGNKTLSGTDPDPNINTGDSGTTPYNGSGVIYQEIVSYGTLAIDTPGTTPATDIAVAGTTGVEFSEVKISATREDFTVSKMAFRNINSSFDDNVAKISVKYPTNGNGSTTETTECTLASGAITCSGLSVFVPNPDTVGYNNYAIVEVIVDMQTISAGADAAEAPEFIATLGGNWEAIGNNSGYKLYEQTIGVTDVSGNGTDSTATTSGTTTSTALSLVTSDGTAFAIGNIVYVDENAGSSYTSASEDYMFVTGISTNTLTVVRAVNGSGTGTIGTGYAYTNGKSIYKYTGILTDVNPMNVQGTKLTVVNQMTSKTGIQNTAEEIMEFIVTANAAGDVNIRKGKTLTTAAEGTTNGDAATENTYTTHDLDGESDQILWGAAGDNTTAVYQIAFTGTATEMDDYDRVSFWIYWDDVTGAGATAIDLNEITLYTSTTKGASDNDRVLSGTCADGAWCQVDVAMPSSDAGDIYLGLEIDDDDLLASDTPTAIGDYLVIDDVVMYSEKIQVDLTLNSNVTIPAAGSDAYLKQNGTIVADGTIGWDTTGTNDETGAVIFVPLGTYNDIQISGTDTFTVEIPTNVFTNATATEMLTANIDLGNSASSNTDFFWYDVEGTDTVPYVGVNSTDKISTSISY